MDTKKIIYVVPSFKVGGAEKFLVSLSNSLCNDPVSQTIINLSKTNLFKEEINKKITFISFPRKNKLDIIPILRLRKLIKTEKPDTIFCLNFFSYFFVRCAMICLRSKSKRIISYHSTIHLNKKDDRLHKIYTSMLTKKDLIVTVSENQTKYTSERYKIPLKYFYTIHNGIDTNHWTLPPEGWRNDTIRAKYNLPLNAKVIIIAALFRPEKNHTGAIKALHLLHTRYQLKAYLLLAGNGPMQENIENTVEELNMSQYVKFAGNQKDLRPFYWSSDLFSLTSSSVETFSIAALEAMACGLPCVLTNIGGASEMIRETYNGYLCLPNENDIAEAWLKGVTGNFSKEAIHNHVDRYFSIDKMACKYKKIFSYPN